MDLLSENITVPSLWDFKGKLDYVDKWLLMESSIPLTAIWVSYLLFVLKIGPEYMKNRDAFKLNNLLIAYNAIQVVFSIYIVYIGLNILQPVKYIYLSCANDDETMRNITFGMHIYFLAKVTELLDTIFFVLRKKNNQVTFLHVYHHTIMVLATWLTLKFEPSYSTIFLGTLNSFVHVIMYAYYGLSAFPSLTKYLWWKKYITRMQLTQFVFILIHFFFNRIFSDCQPSTILSYTISGNGVLFIYLFGDFYIKSYCKNKMNAAKAANGGIKKSNSDIMNGNDSKYVNGSPKLSNGNTESNCVKKIR